MIKRESIHEKCEGCHQIRAQYKSIVVNDDGDWEFEEWYAVCAIFPNPGMIWGNRYCPEKTRHENFVPEWFKR